MEANFLQLEKYVLNYLVEKEFFKLYEDIKNHFIEQLALMQRSSQLEEDSKKTFLTEFSRCEQQFLQLAKNIEAEVNKAFSKWEPEGCGNSGEVLEGFKAGNDSIWDKIHKINYKRCYVRETSDETLVEYCLCFNKSDESDKNDGSHRRNYSTSPILEVTDNKQSWKRSVGAATDISTSVEVRGKLANIKEHSIVPMVFIFLGETKNLFRMGYIEGDFQEGNDGKDKVYINWVSSQKSFDQLKTVKDNELQNLVKHTYYTLEDSSLVVELFDKLSLDDSLLDAASDVTVTLEDVDESNRDDPNISSPVEAPPASTLSDDSDIHEIESVLARAPILFVVPVTDKEKLSLKSTDSWFYREVYGSKLRQWLDRQHPLVMLVFTAKTPSGQICGLARVSNFDGSKMSLDWLFVSPIGIKVSLILGSEVGSMEILNSTQVLRNILDWLTTDEDIAYYSSEEKEVVNSSPCKRSGHGTHRDVKAAVHIPDSFARDSLERSGHASESSGIIDEEKGYGKMAEFYGVSRESERSLNSPSSMLAAVDYTRKTLEKNDSIELEKKVNNDKGNKGVSKSTEVATGKRTAKITEVTSEANEKSAVTSDVDQRTATITKVTSEANEKAEVITDVNIITARSSDVTSEANEKTEVITDVKEQTEISDKTVGSTDVSTGVDEFTTEATEETTEGNKAAIEGNEVNTELDKVTNESNNEADATTQEADSTSTETNDTTTEVDTPTEKGDKTTRVADTANKEADATAKKADTATKEGDKTDEETVTTNMETTTKETEKVKKEDITRREADTTTEETDTSKEEDTTKETDATKKADTTKEADTTKKSDTTKEADTTKKSDTTKKADTSKEADTTEEADTSKEEDTTKETDATKKADTTKEADTTKKSDTTKEADTTKKSDTTKKADTSKEADTTEEADTSKEADVRNKKTDRTSKEADVSNKKTDRTTMEAVKSTKDINETDRETEPGNQAIKKNKQEMKMSRNQGFEPISGFNQSSENVKANLENQPNEETPSGGRPISDRDDEIVTSGGTDERDREKKYANQIEITEPISNPENVLKPPNKTQEDARVLPRCLLDMENTGNDGQAERELPLGDKQIGQPERTCFANSNEMGKAFQTKGQTRAQHPAGGRNSGDDEGRLSLVISSAPPSGKTVENVDGLKGNATIDLKTREGDGMMNSRQMETFADGQKAAGKHLSGENMMKFIDGSKLDNGKQQEISNRKLNKTRMKEKREPFSDQRAKLIDANGENRMPKEDCPKAVPGKGNLGYRMPDFRSDSGGEKTQIRELCELLKIVQQEMHSIQYFVFHYKTRAELEFIIVALEQHLSKVRPTRQSLARNLVFLSCEETSSIHGVVEVANLNATLLNCDPVWIHKSSFKCKVKSIYEIEDLYNGVTFYGKELLRRYIYSIPADELNKSYWQIAQMNLGSYSFK